MTEHTELRMKRRDNMLEAAQKELLKFERREIEFRRKDREERAAELQLPLREINIQ
jgi:hypothetical protein